MVLAMRDMEMLELLSRSGVMSNEQIKKIYGNPKKYHIKRLDRMSKEGYVVRKSGYVNITQKGLQEIGKDKPVRVKRREKQLRVGMVDLVFELSGWEVKFGTETKRERNLNHGMRFSAVINNGEAEYAVYQLNAQNPRPTTVGRIWNEIQELPHKAQIYRAVVLCYTTGSMSAIISKISKPTSKEILILPYPQGVYLLRERATQEFENRIARQFPGLIPIGARRYADYQWKGYDVSVLVTNDAVKHYHLKEHYGNKLTKRENRKIIIICTEEQRQPFSELYPEGIFAVMDNNLKTFLTPTPS